MKNTTLCPSVSPLDQMAVNAWMGGHFLTSELENLLALLVASARLRCNWAMGNRVSASRLSVANLAPAGHAIVGDLSEIAGATLAVEND